MALTPIRMASLNEDGEDSFNDKESTRKYPESCKSAEYVCVDGKPGLTLHWGHAVSEKSVMLLSDLF